MRIKILEPEGEYADAQIWAAQAEVESPPNPFFHAFRPLDVARAIHWAHFTDWALFPHVRPAAGASGTSGAIGSQRRHASRSGEKQEHARAALFTALAIFSAPSAGPAL